MRESVKVAVLAAALTLTALAGPTVLGADSTDEQPRLFHSVPACADDAPTGARPCVWDAQRQGNGEGKSFVYVNGTTFYLDGRGP